MRHMFLQRLSAPLRPANAQQPREPEEFDVAKEIARQIAITEYDVNEHVSMLEDTLLAVPMTPERRRVVQAAIATLKHARHALGEVSTTLLST